MSRGRPRAFDVDEALESALCVFWEKGYEGTSISDLTAAMGINRPSLYATFGNKEALFRKALDSYLKQANACFDEMLSGSDLRAGMTAFLTTVADMHTEGDHPRGCLLIQGALSCGEESEPIKQELAACRAQGETWLRERFKKARKNKELPKDTDVSALARFYSAVLQGMSVQAASGASRKALRGIVKQAMMAWPA